MPTFHFDLVSPERLLFSSEVDQVDLPGADGDFGVLAGHAPLVSLLRPGILTIFAADAVQRILVVGGFAEVAPTGLTVLADMATPVEEADPAMIASAIKDTEEDVADAKDDATRDKARHKLEQLKAVQAVLGQ
jgi:F-type H+-transporting ATPase subunit epsilon